MGTDESIRPVARAECAANGDLSNPTGLGASTGGFGGPNYLQQYGLLSGAPGCGIPTITLSSPITVAVGFQQFTDRTTKLTSKAPTASRTLTGPTSSNSAPTFAPSPLSVRKCWIRNPERSVSAHPATQRSPALLHWKTFWLEPRARSRSGPVAPGTNDWHLSDRRFRRRRLANQAEADLEPRIARGD